MSVDEAGKQVASLGVEGFAGLGFEEPEEAPRADGYRGFEYGSAEDIDNASPGDEQVCRSAACGHVEGGGKK